MTNKSGVIFGVIGYIFFFFCMEGWGVGWKFFGSQESESKKFYDAESIIVTPEGNIRVWELVTMPFQHETVAIR